ncbi:putative ferric-chelate reductase 1 [Coregonus clupeaformis]|uniref:putative ferric-chelate reductase 1 n=1 Tax=Coregonus clupeaformis TaxID=59861 RepID=UPI001E1C49D7|nr:putative ferric-chelate reductase 1 [Coregonus clupeaformis]
MLLACVLRVVRCYSSGKVTGACDNMTPQHKPGAQQSTAPFRVTTDRISFKEGDEIIDTNPPELPPPSLVFLVSLVSLKLLGVDAAGRGGPPFCMLRYCSASLYDGIFGSFLRNAGGLTLVLLDWSPGAGVENSAVSHTSGSSKSSIQAIWRAPTSGNLGSIQFSASFVKDYSTFWVGVRSSPVTYITAVSPANSTSTPITSTTSFALSSKLSNSSAGCGSSKVCFIQPLNCDPGVSPDCYFLSAMTSPGDTAVQLEMTGPSDGYIAIGFSDDQRMGNDDIYICGRDSGGLIQLQHAFSTGRNIPDILPLGNVSDVKSSVNNNIISCSFTTMNPISTQRSAGSSSLYYLMIVHGPTSNGIIGFHTGTFISDTKVDISSPQVATSENEPPIIKAHGSLMLIAWMTTGSLGMIIARYMKGVAKGKHHFGKDVWFLSDWEKVSSRRSLVFARSYTVKQAD